MTQTISKIHVRTGLLAAVILLLAAAPAAAHVPPLAYLTCDVGEEDFTIEITVQEDLFRDWCADRLERLLTPRGEPRETDDSRAAIQEAVSEWVEVKIDLVPVKPVVRSFERKTFVDHGVEWKYQVIKVACGLKGAPRQISISWSKYEGASGWAVDAVQGEIFRDNDGGYFSLQKKEPEIVWHAPLAPAVEKKAWEPPPPVRRTLSVPVATMALGAAGLVGLVLVLLSRLRPRVGLPAVAGCAVLAAVLAGTARVQVDSPFGPSFTMPDKAQAKLIFETLHKNIYRAFDYESEDDIYDTLAHSVTGDLLDQVYAEVYESLIMREEGGAVAKVRSTKILEAKVTLPDAPDARWFKTDCTWQVVGRVGHWGHTHQRTNEYHAEYTVAHEEDGWRIAEVRVLDQRRVQNDSGGSGAVEDKR